jgi:hypothetical protein
MGFVLAVPVPRGSSNDLIVELSDAKVDLAVVPSSNLKYRSQNKNTIASAVVPTTSSILISWHVVSEQAYVISRAKYKGKLNSETFTFNAQYDVELFTNESINVALMPNTVTLNDVKVDEKVATIFDQDDEFQVILQGKGLHTINVVFQVQVIQK